MSNPTRRQIIERAQTDPTFRAKLISDPKAVIEEALGEKFRPTVKVTVLQEDPDTIYYVLSVRKKNIQGMPDSWFVSDHPGTEP
jgi:hypothetical protein